MQSRIKYVWDISAEHTFSSKQLNAINQISEIISKGGSIAELKQKMRYAKVL